MSQKVLFHLFFILQLGFCHARISLTPFGEGYTEQGPCLSFYEYGALPFSPLSWTKCKSWSMGWWKICGSSTKCYSCSFKLKGPHFFPHKKQYPLKPEVKEGLKPIIKNLKEQRLLIPCNSPCNTILGIKKSNGKRRLVQDLRVINEAVVPLHPMVPNPYTLVWNSWTSQIFLSNWFKRCLLFSAFGRGKSISICLWRPYAASFSVNLDSFVPGIMTVFIYLNNVCHGIYKTFIVLKGWCYNM